MLTNQPNFISDIAEFHAKFGLAYDGKPRVLSPELSIFRGQFMQEELNEWNESHSLLKIGEINHAECLEQQLDAMVDLMYVLLGTVHLQGLDLAFAEAWRRVHHANMTKVRTERAEDSKRGSTFDVIKPPGWVAPDHSDLVYDHAHQGEVV